MSTVRPVEHRTSKNTYSGVHLWVEPSSSEKKTVAQNLRTEPSTRQIFLFFGLVFVRLWRDVGFVIGFVVRNGFRLCSVWGFSVVVA